MTLLLDEAETSDILNLLAPMHAAERLVLLQYIAGGDPSPAEMQLDLGLTRLSTSNHLRTLKLARLVTLRRGPGTRNVHYSLSERGRRLLEALQPILIEP